MGTGRRNCVLLANDQVIIASDAHDTDYIFRKLDEEYELWGLTINTSKTEYLKPEVTQKLNIWEALLRQKEHRKYVTFVKQNKTVNDNVDYYVEHILTYGCKCRQNKDIRTQRHRIT